MDIQEELRINGHQPIYAFKGTETGDLFEAMIAKLTRSGFNPSNNIYYLMDKAYSQGIIQGKRIERAKKKV